MSCGVSHRHGSDPALLWLWCRQVATALIGPLAWEAPYAMEAAQEMAKRQKDKKKKILPGYSLRILHTNTTERPAAVADSSTPSSKELLQLKTVPR